MEPFTHNRSGRFAAGAVRRTNGPSNEGLRNTRTLHVAALFAGIGGLELGLARAGHQADLFCEIDQVAQAVLREKLGAREIIPDVSRVDEIIEAMPANTDLITAGFPCQDLSQAGETNGIAGSRSGLVSRVFDLLCKRRVPWVLIENVPFMLRLERGRAMTSIVEALEDLHYQWAYRVIDSEAFGVPQRRERVFLLASCEGDPRGVLLADDVARTKIHSAIGQLAHGFYWTEGTRGLGWAVDSVPTIKGGSTVGIPAPPAIVMPDLTVITPDIRDVERMQGFDEGWTEPALTVAKRGARWKLVGNAVTVNVSAWIGERLATPGEYDPTSDPVLLPGSPWPKAAWFDGNRRCASAVSTWPVSHSRPPLHGFLNHPGNALSARATDGFLSRATSSTLRFAPGFLDAVKRHYDEMTGTSWLRR
jgi:DNA (cytosine-5)-methyltransferase 1